MGHIDIDSQPAGCTSRDCKDVAGNATPSADSPITANTGGKDVNRAPIDTPQNCLVIDQVGANPINIKYLWNGYSGYHAVARCFSIPLKAGGSLEMTWNHFPGVGSGNSQVPYPEDLYAFNVPSFFDVLGDGWMTGGQGGMFSFLPYLTTAGDPFASTYTRRSDKGTVLFEGTSGGYYVPNVPIPVIAKYHNGVKEFMEYNLETHEYFVFGAKENAKEGRLLRYYDRNGNELLYHYSDRNGSPPDYYLPILRKITGSLGSIIPYFEYGGSANEEKRPSPITKITLKDSTGQLSDRTITFDYDSNTEPTLARLNKITYPQGCTQKYQIVSDYYVHPTIKKSVDAEGYTVYFNYEDINDTSTAIHRVVEPEGRDTYYNYNGGVPGDNETQQGPLGKQDTTYQYHFSPGLGAQVPELRKLKDAMQAMTYYQWTSGSQLMRVREANANMTYYEYNWTNNTSKKIRQADAAEIEYVYEPNGFDIHKVIGPRNAGGFPVVTYFEYDSKGNRTAVVDPLNNSIEIGYDTVGHPRKTIDPRNFTTYFNYGASTGNLESIVDPLGNTPYFRYSPYGLPTQSISARWKETGSFSGFTTQNFYDNLNQLHKTVDPNNAVTYFDYDSRGDLIGTVNARGTASLSVFNGLQLVKKTAAVSSGLATMQYQYYVYDTYKNLVKYSDPNKNWNYFIYDQVNRPIVQRNALGFSTYFYYDSVGDNVAIRDPRGYTTYYFYDTMRRKTKERDANGSYTYYFYDKADNVYKSFNANQSSTYFGYDANNRVTLLRDALNNESKMYYDQSGNIQKQRSARGYWTYYNYDKINQLASTANPLGQHTYFFYDANGNQTKVRDALGHTNYFLYDSLNRMHAQRDPAGNFTYFYFDSVGNQCLVRDALENKTYFGYDAINRPVIQRDAIGAEVLGGYDPNGNLRKERNQRGYWTYYNYDAANRRTSTVNALNKTTSYTYDQNGNPTQIVDSNGNASNLYYDKLNRRYKIGNALGHYAYFEFDKVGNQIVQVDQMDNKTYFGYDGNNRLVVTRDPLQGTTLIVYNADGMIQKQKDRRGYWTYFNYDATNRQTSTTTAIDATTTRKLNRIGNAYGEVPPIGGSSYFDYDTRNLVVKIFNGLSKAWDFLHDPIGTMFDSSGPENVYGDQTFGNSAYGGGPGIPNYYHYDALNRIISSKDGENGVTHFAYDLAGNMRKVDDPINNTTYFEFDALNRTTEIVTGDAVTNRHVFFGYDGVGNRTKEVDPLSRVTYYQYNALNLPVKNMDPLGRYTYFAYDPNLNLHKTKDRNQVVTYYVYDELNRKIRTEYPSEKQYFTYDADGNLVRTIDGWGKSYFTYDNISRMRRYATPYASVVYFDFDKASNRTRIVYPVDGKDAYYVYDQAQRMSKVVSPNDETIDFVFDDANNLSLVKHVNTSMPVYGRDKAGRISSITHVEEGSGNIITFKYDRLKNGNIRRTRRENDFAIYYDYDQFNQLLGEYWRYVPGNEEVYAFIYTYDNAGNRSTMTRKAHGLTVNTQNYYYDNANQAWKVWQGVPVTKATYYTYDNNGALIKEWDQTNTTYYEYAQSQLISKIVPPTGSPWQFKYDASMNCYAIDKGGATTYYLWDGLNLLEERDTSGALVARYTHGYAQIAGIGSVLEVKRHAEDKDYFQYLHADERGTVYAITDENKDVTTEYVMDAFGVQVGPTTGTDPNIPNDLIYQANWLTFDISGRRYCLSKYRLYDPALGRFLSRDPAGDVDGLNLYLAFGNDPVNNVDPTGKDYIEYGPLVHNPPGPGVELAGWIQKVYWVVTTKRGKAGDVVRRAVIGNLYQNFSKIDPGHAKDPQFPAQIRFFKGLGGGSLREWDNISEFEAAVESGKAETPPWLSSDNTVDQIYDQVEIALQNYLGIAGVNNLVKAKIIEKVANDEVRVAQNMPALSAIQEQPWYTKYPLAFAYSFENTITLGALENQDRTQARLDLELITLTEARSQARWNVGKAALGTVLTLAPGASSFYQGSFKYAGTGLRYEGAVYQWLERGAQGGLRRNLAAYESRLFRGTSTRFYHGTSSEFANAIRTSGIDVRAGRTAVDFGQGFYTTSVRAHAARMARNVAARTGSSAEVLTFRIQSGALNKFKGLVFAEADESWRLFAIGNRSGAASLHSFDYVRGPVVKSLTTFEALPYPIYNQTSIHTERLAKLLFRGLR